MLKRFSTAPPTEEISRRRANNNPEVWYLHYADARVGMIVERRNNGCWAMDLRVLPRRCPERLPRRATPSFEAAYAAFEAAWREYLPKRSEADFQEWRDDQAKATQAALAPRFLRES